MYFRVSSCAEKQMLSYVRPSFRWCWYGNRGSPSCARRRREILAQLFLWARRNARIRRFDDVRFPVWRGSASIPRSFGLPCVGRLRCVFAHPEAPRFLRTRSLGVGGHYPDRVSPAGELLALIAQLVRGRIVGEVGRGYGVAVQEKLDVGGAEVVFGVLDGRAYEGTTGLDFRVGSGPEVGDRGRAIARRIASRRLRGLRQRLPGGAFVIRCVVRDLVGILAAGGANGPNVGAGAGNDPLEGDLGTIGGVDRVLV